MREGGRANCTVGESVRASPSESRRAAACAMQQDANQRAHGLIASLLTDCIIDWNGRVGGEDYVRRERSLGTERDESRRKACTRGSFVHKLCKPPPYCGWSVPQAFQTRVYVQAPRAFNPLRAPIVRYHASPGLTICPTGHRGRPSSSSPARPATTRAACARCLSGLRDARQSAPISAN